VLKAVILDAYGTLLDTGDASVRATAEILRRHGVDLPPREIYATWKRHLRALRVAGGDFRTEAALFEESLRLACAAHGLPAGVTDDVGVMLATWGTRSAFPDAAESVARLRTRWKVFVASNSDDAPLRADLARNGLAVDRVFSSENLRCYKPDPSFYRAVLHAIGVDPADAVSVGDSEEDDVEGPRRIGLAGIRLDRTGRSPSPAINDLTGLMERLSAA